MTFVVGKIATSLTLLAMTDGTAAKVFIPSAVDGAYSWYDIRKHY
jgi:hypothetical protein